MARGGRQQLILAGFCVALACVVPHARAQEAGSTAAAAPPGMAFYATLQQAEDAHPDQMLQIQTVVWGSYEYRLSANAKAKAQQKILDQAQQAHATDLLLINDISQNFAAGNPPPGHFMGGDYWIEAASPVAFVPLTPDNLMTEVNTHLFTNHAITNPVIEHHLVDLLERAAAPPFATLVPPLDDLVRDPRAEQLTPVLAQALVLAVVAHPTPGLDETLARWAKYHKHPTVRLTAMRALIKDGHRDQVDALMATETDAQVKEAISRDLL